MDYNVVLTQDAEEDLDQFVSYLLFEKKSEQAAKNLLDDFEATKKKLESGAYSLADLQNPRLKKFGYKRIDFEYHRYFMLYRIEEDKIIIDNIFYELQDYQNCLW